ncbi:MAG: phosphate ABC transporter permease subunit PstA [Myxococcota bacterium]
MKETNNSILGGTSPDIRGGIGIFICGGALAVLLIAGLLFFGLLFSRGADAFAVKPLVEWQLKSGAVELVQELDHYENGEVRARMANREFHANREDHLIAGAEDIISVSIPNEAVRIERTEYGPFHGYLDSVDDDGYHVRLPDGTKKVLATNSVMRIEYPNQLSFWGRLGSWFKSTWTFLVSDPREANTEGGIYPALVGTALMVLLMTLIVVPFGVMAAVFLNEYAKDTWLVRLVRIAVNNLAGVPSIVYGVFGLGFFIYGVGGAIDDTFFSDSLPTPTFGAGGLLWASLTMALLTLPVVIVATEEALRAVPRDRRDAALALGATRWETLKHIILPGAKPGILTGTILAISRAAGEVAPLMLTGVVMSAQQLPINGDFPFLHLEQRFMHLGFHVYSVGFQSPNVEAAEPLVYATAAVLLFLVLALNIVAIRMRSNVRKKLQGK